MSRLIKKIEKILMPQNSDVHFFVSHEQVSQVYTRFREKHPDNIIRLENNAVDYVYDLRSLTAEQQQCFVKYCMETYISYGCYNENSKILNIQLPLNSMLRVPQCFSMRAYKFHVFDAKGQDVGSLGLKERNAQVPFTLDLFLNTNAQSKGIGTRAMQVLSDFVDDEQLGCKNVHLVVGSSNPKAALVYARSGYKPANQFLINMRTALKCSALEAYAKILCDSSQDKLPSGICSLMVRERGAANQMIDSKWSEQELLTYVSRIDSALPKVKLPSVGTIFEQQTAAGANINRLPADKEDMNAHDDQLKKDILALEGARERFLGIHNKRLSQEKSTCFIGFFRKTNLRPDMTMQDIINHAKRENNRSRKIMVELGWLTKDGKISNNAPECIRNICRNGNEKSPLFKKT
jgi:Acetyltransferase (GNAT) domain